jgi:ribonuclease III
MLLINNHELENKLNITFKDKGLLQQALIHKSFVNENVGTDLRNNERLEFLGDAILSISISTHIFYHFPDYPEGELAKMRAVIVSEPSLASRARELDIGKYLLLGKGEEISGGRDRDSILADAMEALFAAIYLDQGFEPAKNFIINLFRGIINKVVAGDYIKDYKTILQEILQKDGSSGPNYSVIDEKGPDHNKRFLVKVFHQDKMIGKGEGFSKKEAEQEAARSALNNLEE